MEEKKSLKISLSTTLLFLAILVIIVMAYYIYTEKTNYNKQISELEANTTNMQNTIDNLQGKIDSMLNTINSDNNSSVENDNTDNATKIYNECEKQCKGVVYRRETGESSGFFIKNGILYAGKEDMVETQTKTSGITENVKYVVPLNKQINKTIALTEDGKLYINKEENGLYGNSFERLLSSYDILEILQLPNEKEFKFLCSDGKIIDINGTVYLNLL